MGSQSICKQNFDMQFFGGHKQPNHNGFSVVVWLKIREDDICRFPCSIAYIVVVWLKIREDDIWWFDLWINRIVVVWLKIREDDIINIT